MSMMLSKPIYIVKPPKFFSRWGRVMGSSSKLVRTGNRRLSQLLMMTKEEKNNYRNHLDAIIEIVEQKEMTDEMDSKDSNNYNNIFDFLHSLQPIRF